MSKVDPRDLVSSESPNRIRDHLQRQSSFNPTKSLTAFTSQLAQEYEDRFLVELIQNAYDAHPGESSGGRVHVRLDEAAQGGPVLYVANTGRPFTEANFEALTNVAQSSKPPGEGIGNKGVGFRSVLQVCESPEIYSCADASRGATFDGFCFGFATDDQIRAMVVNETDYETIKQDFSRYLLPVLAASSDPQLDILRRLGMVTVVRLRLASERALELARAQVQRLLRPTPPIALFLDRLSSIAVEHVGGDGELAASRVDRTVTEVEAPADWPTLRVVETAGRRFLTTTRVLRAVEMRRVVAEAIARGELDASWSEWDSDAEVALAVPIGDESGDASWPSTYTHLPMRVAAPTYAHLHAPFHTKLARLDLNEQSSFNSFLIDSAAELAVDTIELLAKEDGVSLDPKIRRAAAVDLLCWDSEHLANLEAALEGRDLQLGSSPLIPARGPAGVSWAGLDDVRTWDHTGLEVLTAGAIEAHAPLVDASLGVQRVGRLRALSERSLFRSLGPSDDEVAEWVEEIAVGLPARSVGNWNKLLNDVAAVFASREPAALQGRLILLDHKGTLRRSGPWAAQGSGVSDPTVFIPPRHMAASSGEDPEQDAELFTVPKNLQRAITFLNEGIKVRTRTGRTFKRTPVGELLQKADLVEQFELAAVLSHLERLLAGRVSDATSRQALSWVYVQERASRANFADLGRLGLRVPTAVGWLPASQAVFSPGWDTPRASTVAALVKDSAGKSPSIQALGDGAIPGPQDWPFKVKDVDAFRGFLARCGVRDGLFPVALRSKTAVRMNGVNFTAAAIAHRFGLTEYEEWARHIDEVWEAVFVGPYTPYTGQQRLWIVPGQDGFEALGTSAKDRLAAAILESVAEWPMQSWSYHFQRRSSHHRSKPDPQVWPSPAKTFVERAGWFPMSDAGRRDDRYFVSPARGWTFDETTTETAPRFARLAPIEHRRRLARSQRAQQLLEAAGLQAWNRPRSAGPRLVELADLARSGEISESELPSIRRAASKAWSELASRPLAAVPPDLALLVSRGASLEVLEPSASDEPEVVVHDTPPGLVAQVLEASGLPILVADPADGDKIAQLMGDGRGFVVRPTSAIEARVVLDGRELSPSMEYGGPLLTKFDTWLVRTLLAIVDLRSSRFVRVTDKVLHNAEARLRRTRVVAGSVIELVVDDRTIAATGRLAECVHLDDPDTPLIVLSLSDADIPSWLALELIAEDLAELMGQPQVASEIRAAALAFQLLIGEWREPSDVEMAKVLRCGIDEVTHVLRSLRTSSDHLRLLLAPFVGVYGDLDAALRIKTEMVDDVTELQAVVAEMIGEDLAAELLQSAARAESVDGLRREMKTDLGQLNTMLLGLGESPLDFLDRHEAALSNYLADHRARLSASLRLRYLRRFEQGVDLTDYVDARGFQGLSTKSSWLHDHEVPTDSMLDELLTEWLDGKGEPPPIDQPMEPIDDVQAANRALLERTLPTIARLIGASFTKSGTDAPEVWSSLPQVRDSLWASGCLDFVALDEGALLTWLARLHLWPSGMELTLSPSELDLSSDDLDQARSPAAVADEQRRRRRTELDFGERTFDVAGDQLEEFMRAVEESADDEFLRTRPTLVSLSTLAPAKRRGGTGPPIGPRTYKGGQLTQEQTAAIGLAGELLAYRWLQTAYRETTPDSWVSANRAVHLGGHPGNDGLGYDFRIARKSETLFFEVKATKTDEYAFDIGESELRAAKAARKGCYRIIFIRAVLTPEERELFVLPNPLEGSYADCFAQVNQGMRLRFDPATGSSS